MVPPQMLSFLAFFFVNVVLGSDLAVPAKSGFLTGRFHRSSLKCMQIDAKQCQNLGYNETKFPNFAGDEIVSAATEALTGFDPLIGTRCSEEIRFFLCSVYFPMCTEKVTDPIGPCRSLCQRVQSRCAPVMKEFSYKWPIVLNCDKFLEENSPDHMCMEGPATTSQTFGGDGAFKDAEDDIEDTSEEESVFHDVVQVPRTSRPLLTGLRHDHGYQYAAETFGGVAASQDGACSLRDWVYVNRTAQCVPKCSTNLDFSIVEINKARSTLVVGSMVSVCFTVICLVAAVIRGNSFNASRPLNRSLFCCTLCFAFSASLYAISLVFKDSIACIEYNDDLLYAGRGLPNTLCTFVATLLYYFGTAGRLWWLMLSVAWRWNMKEHSVAEMEKFVFQSHITCWALPLFLVMMALMAQSVHPELLSGICLVGTASQANHQVFVALREFLIMLASALVLISGCLTTVQRRSDVTATGSATPSAGFIGVLYPLAATFLLLSNLQNQFTPLLGKWTTLAALQLLADPSLGTLIGAAYFIYLLYACYQHGPGLHEKQGYLPAMNGGQPPTTTSCVTPSVYHQVSPQGRIIASLTTGTSANATYYVQATGDSLPQVPQVPIPPVPSM